MALVKVGAMLAQLVAVVAVPLIVFWNFASGTALVVVMVAPIFGFFLGLFCRIKVAYFRHRKGSLRSLGYGLIWLVNQATPGPWANKKRPVFTGPLRRFRD